MLIKQIFASEAFEILKNDQNSILIDVRTIEEFKLIGIPDSSYFNSRMILLPWQSYYGQEFNPDFLSTLNEKLTAFFPNKTPENILELNLIFICKSGVRSYYASNYTANFGFKNCFNISDGFEGNSSKNLQDIKVRNGWKTNNLPWRKQ